MGQALQIRKEDEEWLLAKDDEGGASGWWKGLEVGGEGKMDDPKKRKEVFMRAVAEHEECLRAHADAEEEAEKDRVWRERVEKRRRAEMVLGIFGEGGGGAAQVGDDGKDVVRNDVNGGAVVAGRKRLSSPGGLGNPKPKRKRKRRRTGVPDDESSSSSSSSGSSDDSSSSQSEDEDNSSAGMGKPVNGRTAVAIPNGTINKGAAAVDLTAETDTSSSEESSDSDSESDTSSTTGSSESGSSSSDG